MAALTVSRHPQTCAACTDVVACYEIGEWYCLGCAYDLIVHAPLADGTQQQQEAARAAYDAFCSAQQQLVAALGALLTADEAAEVAYNNGGQS